AQFNVLANDAFQHALNASNKLDDVERFGFDRLAAAEGEKLRYKLSRPRASREYLLELPRHLRMSRQVLKQQGAVSVDDGQQIIEVVRDAAGQPADRLQFVR